MPSSGASPSPILRIVLLAVAVQLLLVLGYVFLRPSSRTGPGTGTHESDSPTGFQASEPSGSDAASGNVPGTLTAAMGAGKRRLHDLPLLTDSPGRAFSPEGHDLPSVYFQPTPVQVTREAANRLRALREDPAGGGGRPSAVPTRAEKDQGNH